MGGRRGQPLEQQRDRLERHVGKNGRAGRTRPPRALPVSASWISTWPLHAVHVHVLPGGHQGHRVVVEGDHRAPPQLGRRYGEDAGPSAHVDQTGRGRAERRRHPRAAARDGARETLLEQGESSPSGGVQAGAEPQPGVDHHVDERTGLGAVRGAAGSARCGRGGRGLPRRAYAHLSDDYRPEMGAPAFHPIARDVRGLDVEHPRLGEVLGQQSQEFIAGGGAVGRRIEHQDEPLLRRSGPARPPAIRRRPLLLERARASP